MTIKELNPQIVWKNFHALTQIPRPSKHEEKVSEYLYNFGISHGLETYKDEIGNVIIRKPATPGCENLKGVILQGHMDMVPQKNSDKVHDFEKDPIETWIDGEWVKAKGTTLGADNGLGLALSLAVLESDDIKHGPIEFLATIDEETGMTGARFLKSGLLKGEILMNMDSEEEGELCVGCAGGLDLVATTKYDRLEPEKDWLCYSLTVKGFKGGHSGMDIVLYRGNANVAAARLLYVLMDEADAKLIDFEGGTLRNAIPREAFATVYVEPSKLELAKAAFEKEAAAIKAEFSASDPDAQLSFEPYVCAETECCDHDECLYAEPERALDLMRTILACPNGVERMSDYFSGIAETSSNLAIVNMYKGEMKISFLMRSSIDAAKVAFARRLKSIFKLAGFEVKTEGGYSGWAPNPKSDILLTMKKAYMDLFGKEIVVTATHGGLECGILGGNYPGLDMISCGPTLRSPHSPDERAFIPSVEKCWTFVKRVLETIPEK